MGARSTGDSLGAMGQVLCAAAFAFLVWLGLEAVDRAPHDLAAADLLGLYVLVAAYAVYTLLCRIVAR